MTSRTRPGWPVLVALAAVLVHVRAIDNGFALDDVRLVESNPAIASLAHVPKLFVEPYWNVPGEHYGLYRPLTIVSLAIDRAVFGAAPFGFHLVNVLLHAIVAALAWFCLRRAGTHYGTALAGALLFAVLPIHTEAVANVAGRAELLAALFALAAWIAHRRASDGTVSGHRWALGAAVFYLAAILSKEGAILAPLVFLADDILRERKESTRRGRLMLGYAAAFAVMLCLRGVALGAHQTAAAAIPLDNPAAAEGPWPRVLTAVWVQLKYALLCVWPRTLVSDYSFDAIPVARSLADPRVLGGLAFLAMLAMGAAWGVKRSRPVALAIAIWIAFFLPASNLLFPIGTIMAERLAYLPSLGVCLAFGHAVAFAARRETSARGGARTFVVAGLATAALFGFAARTWARVPAWKDNLTLALTDCVSMPRSAKLQAGAGMFLAEAGRSAEAEGHLRLAVTIYPAYAQMHYNLAVLLVRRGARDEAVEHLRRAIELAPDNPRPRRLLDQLR